MKKKKEETPQFEDVLFSDIFDKPVAFDENVKKQNEGKVQNNIRLSKGMWRTDKEKEKYLNNFERLP